MFEVLLNEAFTPVVMRVRAAAEEPVLKLIPLIVPELDCEVVPSNSARSSIAVITSLMSICD